MNQRQMETFRTRLRAVGDCVLYPSVNTNIPAMDGEPAIKSRPHRVYFFTEWQRWPGRLEKYCDTPRCIKHYTEKEIPDPDDMTDSDWGSGRRYAAMYGVSEGYISRLRRMPR